jgi:anti-sigma regulatory factor (Ser/Thr protein kinase)
MKLKSNRSDNIRTFIIENVSNHSSDIAGVAAKEFDVSRQAINSYLKKLVQENILFSDGATRNKRYTLVRQEVWAKKYAIEEGLAEDIVWRNDIAQLLGFLPKNVINIWDYAFSEMFNNAIDHSEGKFIDVQMVKTAFVTSMIIKDDGIGIFKKIQTKFNLLDERHAILELSKGKLTTAPDRHSGEGIFFTSRIVNDFAIFSGETHFSHEYGEDHDWIFEIEPMELGTKVIIQIENHTKRVAKDIFDYFTSGDDFGFFKTIVPVRLAQYGDNMLVSRSQAKRLLTRVESFKSVIFDFEGVNVIGQAFADEIFRVFHNQNKGIDFFKINANEDILKMISRATTGFLLIKQPPNN